MWVQTAKKQIPVFMIVYDKDDILIQWGKDSLFNVYTDTYIWRSTWKTVEFAPSLTPHIKINCK